MQDLELSVTICSWNTREDLRACLASLQAVRDEARFEVIVVDNASHDDSPDMVENDFPWVRLMRMSENLGFTKGHNAAMAARSAGPVFLLNSDTIVHAGALRTMLDYAREHPEVGIVGPKLLNSDGSLQYSCRRFPNPVAAIFRNTPIGRLFPNNRFTREYLMTDWNHDEVREVDWVSGAAFYVSKDAVDRVGVFDPDFYMYCEDVDWCYRIWQAGLKVVYLPQAAITHAIGRSTDQVANKMIVRFHRSMLRFYRKNMLRHVAWPLRPGAYLLAGAGLTARAGIFLAKNWSDEMERRIRRLLGR